MTGAEHRDDGPADAGETRDYHSPLREEQARRTREQILDALIDLVSDEGASDLSIRDLAARAGVAERTVYRHFADRQALLDGLVEHVGEIGHWASLDLKGCAVDAIPELCSTAWSGFDELERQTRALVLLNVDPARVARDSSERAAQIRQKLTTDYSHLPADDVAGLAGLIQVLASSRTWLRFRDEYGLSGREGARFVGWTMALVLRELERGATVPPAPT